MVMGFSDFKEVMWVMRVSSFCWVLTSCACNLERAFSREVRHSFSMVSKGTVLRICFPKMSEEESSARKYRECKESVLGVLEAQNTAMVNPTRSTGPQGRSFSNVRATVV